MDTSIYTWKVAGTTGSSSSVEFKIQSPAGFWYAWNGDRYVRVADHSQEPAAKTPAELKAEQELAELAEYDQLED